MGLGDYIKKKIDEKVQSSKKESNERREHKEELNEIREKSRWEERKAIAKKEGKQEAHGGRTIKAPSGLEDMGFFLGSKPQKPHINPARDAGNMVYGQDIMFGNLGYTPKRSTPKKASSGSSKTITVRINMPKSKEEIEAEKEKKRRREMPDYLGLGF